MGYDNKKGNMTTEKFENKEKVSDVLKYPFVDAKDRNIRKEVLEKFGVRAALSPKDGKTVEAYYFPSYNQKGKIVGFTKQDITKDKSEKGHWTAVGSVSIGNKLFGQEVAEKVSRKRTNLIATEGQWDTLSVYQSLVDSVKGTQYASLEPLVVSIPMGTANAVESLLHNHEYVKSHDQLTIFFDDDFATPAELKKGIMKGKEATEAVAGAFVGEGITLFTLTPAEGYKDASDYMQADESKELAKLVSFGKKAYTAEKIVKASDIPLEDLIKPRVEGVYVHEFPDLMKKIHGFRVNELVTLCSPSGVGKSTVTSIFSSAFVEAGKRVGMIFLEENLEETFQRILAKKLGVNYLKFKDNPTQVASLERITEAYDQIVKNNSIVVLDHFGSLGIDDLMQKIKNMHVIEKCDYILLDHLSLLGAANDVVDERRTMDRVMTELAAYAAAHPVGIIAVSHINRSAAEQFKPPKLRDGEEPKPYWIQVSKEMMRSSAALEQLSWIVLGLEPRIEVDRSRGPVRLTVLKNRPWSYTGVADTFKLNDDTWAVELVGQDEF